MMMHSAVRLIVLGLLCSRVMTVGAEERPYAATILEDGPAAWWRLNDDYDPDVPAMAVVRSEIPMPEGQTLDGRLRGAVRLLAAGPHPGEYPDFEPDNAAAAFSDGSGYIVITDPGAGSPLDFDNGDAITLEAWIRWEGQLQGSYPYIVGKGRTHNPGTSRQNQNYSLRLATGGGGPFISFFFCDAETPPSGDGIKDEGHRWTSTTPVPSDAAWHHVAVTYEFGRPDSIHGYIDGEPVKGKWDMGGPTDKRPVTDDDELWIGSSMSGGSTFGGEIDEVALYRTALTPEQIRRHVTINLQESEYAIGRVHPESVPHDRVRVEIMEGVPLERTWNFRTKKPVHLFDTQLFALTELPQRYIVKGLIEDRPLPCLLHLTTQIDVPEGDYEFIIRTLDATRLYIDGELVTETPFMDLRSDGHQPLHPITETPVDVLSIPVAHHEAVAKVSLDAGPHVISLYRLVGTKGAGMRVGELVVGYRQTGEPLRFLGPIDGPQSDRPFTDAGWLSFLDWERDYLRNVNQQSRLAAAVAEEQYWQERHEITRSMAPPAVEIPSPEENAVQNSIDRFINAKLAETGTPPQPLVDDFSFLRRLALDTTGVIPTTAQIERFFNDPPETRRALAVERLLADQGWADHWTAYWQDVLAENPGLTKPELNNTGPFRWFIYESFLDNKPFDRFVTELLQMEGSRLRGGPAGFGMATQNDVPMAAKAHVVGEAFLAVEMKCARCHDAPYHDVLQQDLFQIAAMLNRAPLKVPGTSSVPAESLRDSIVQVSLHPGSSVEPHWPFAELFNQEVAAIPDGVLRKPDDSRERLAALVTLPSNDRFARVIVNRMWQRYLGRGLIEPVEDWEQADCSHPDLLDYLARELVLRDYDLKHIAGLIFNSHVYQRAVVPGLERDSTDAALFAGPIRRRMTGEQIADSLYRAAGRPFGAEELTMDADGRRPDSTFLDLGTPVRAWEFAAVSNERDRPSMSLPVAQSIIDLLSAYGWRQQRQDPLTIRDESLTPLQPMLLANGAAVQRAIDFTDDSGLTALALDTESADDFVEQLFLRILSRPATTGERELFAALLSDGYDSRITAGPEAVPPTRIHRSPRTWSNHLHADATDDAMRRAAEVESGEPPSARLDPEWRQRAEDAVWSLVNLPEFVFVP